MIDPIITYHIWGLVTSPIPNVFTDLIVPAQTDRTSGEVNAIQSSISFRQSAPAVNTTALRFWTFQAYRHIADHINGSLSIEYSVPANSTTITIQSGADRVQMVVPINLQQVFSDQDPKMQAGALKLGDSFSGTVGSIKYQGRLANHAYTERGKTVVLFAAYQMLDSDGNTLLYARANNGGMPDIRIPGAGALGTADVRAGVEANSTLPPNCGSGTFSQALPGQRFIASSLPPFDIGLKVPVLSDESYVGQTLTGTFQPSAFTSWIGEAAQEKYLLAH